MRRIRRPRSPVAIALAPLFVLLLSATSADGAPPPDRVPDPAAEATPRFSPDQLLVRLDAALAASLPSAPGLDALGDAADPDSLAALLTKLGALGLEPVFGSTPEAGPPGSKGKSGGAPGQSGNSSAPPTTPAVPPELAGTFLVALEEGSDVLSAVAAASAHPNVVYAEPNRLYRIAAEPLPDLPFLPDDPFVTQDGLHWSEGAWGQAFPDLWGLRAVRAVEAWNLFDEDGSGAFEPDETRPGEGIVVAVIDTGLDRSHRDLAANVWHNPGEIPDNGIDDDANGFVDDVSGWDFVSGDPDPEDPHGHGTHVTGTIAARANNATDVAGVAPWARILPLRGFSENGIGHVVHLSRAVRYAADAGAHVLSTSWGGFGDSPTLVAAFDYATDRGVLAVASAGNSNARVAAFQPAGLDNVIAVAATDPDDVRASFSNFGPGIDVSAPGIDVLSLGPNAGDHIIALVRPDLVVTPHTVRLSGTSMACPHVSGALAVIWSRHPDESATEIRGRLLAGAEPIDALNPGFEGQLGSGRLDLEGSLLAEPRPLLVLQGLEPAGLRPGNESGLVVRIVNRWAEARSVEVSLSTDDPLVTILDGHSVLGDMPPGAHAANADDPFDLRLDSSVPFGHEIVMELALEGEGGLLDTLTLSLRVTLFEDTGESSGLPLKSFLPWRLVIRDYDGDDRSDALFIGISQTTLHRNLGDGRFTDSTVEAGLFVDGFSTSDGLFVDVDDDADVDVFIGGLTRNSASRLFLNDGSGVFADHTDASGVGSVRAYSAAALDYDRDGRVDFFGAATLDLLPGAIKPESFFLLRNLGEARFEDVHDTSCLPSFFSLVSGQVVAFDYDSDGDTDVMWLSAFSNFRLHRNEGDGRFTDVTRDALLTAYRNSDMACRAPGRTSHGHRCPSTPGVAVAVGDYDNDGDIDVFVTGQRGFPNALYRNEGDGSFQDVIAEAGDLAEGGVSGWHAGNDFFDFDNDGDLDLYVTNDGERELVTNVLYRNEGDGSFRRITELAFPDSATPGGAAAAVGDIDGDGALDIYAPSGVLGPGLRGALFRNLIGNDNHWLGLRLVGVASNRDAYGARVLLTSGGATQLREVHTSSVESQPLHFGLGAAGAADVIEVRWPSGIVQLLRNVPGDAVMTVVEPAQCLDDATAPGCESVTLANLPTPLPAEIPACEEQGRPSDKPRPGSNAQGPKVLLSPP